MIIDTKFNIGDKCWVLHNNKVDTAFIEKISINGSADMFGLKFDIIFNLNRYNDKVNFYEFTARKNECFKTKEDLLKSL